VMDGNTTVGMANIRIKKVPILGGGLAFISFGPLFRRYTDLDFVNLTKILDVLKEEYILKRGFLLRIQPSFTGVEDFEELCDAFKSQGFELTRAHRNYRTVCVDLSPPMESLRESFKRRWRRHLSQAEREDIKIEVRSGSTALDDFANLHEEFVDRKGFRTDLDARFYSRVQKLSPETDRFEVLLAHVSGKMAGGIVVSLLGDVMVYLLGGRNEFGTRTRASYLLHWKAIEMAKARGIRWYDLGGIDPENNRGVYTFKSGLGGSEIAVPGPFEIKMKRYREEVIRFFEKAYRSKLRSG
ncbi:MAG: peptidoglycan bridge formation glycyltransferase FemA/FemB family protein, partial [Candidatus Omnitrophica bacterium]|nr:peptidoglycan bridge formation glycyltransferase FemA/FemB family protein [Candidatus Omnitrophota bacterium]